MPLDSAPAAMYCQRQSGLVDWHAWCGFPLGWAVWVLVAVLGAFGFAMLAGLRGDGGQVNAIWTITAAICTYAVAYRFYSK